ncbi:hypothetical protein OROGR_028255 [Orobanche gracilis]
MPHSKKPRKDTETITTETHIQNQQILNLQAQSTLLPGLPSHIARLCLSSLHPSLLYKVCRSWRRLLDSPDFPPYFSLYAILCRIPPRSCPPVVGGGLRGQLQTHSINLFCFDPISSKWKALPKPPSDTATLPLLRRHPSYMSRILPTQSITAANKLVVVAANTETFLPALDRPLVFDPSSRNWAYGPPLHAPRRWCIAGSVHGSVYVASGIGAQYDGDVARSIERWDMSKKETDWSWEKVEPFRDGRFSREAVEAVGYRGKLCMVSMKGKGIKQGAVYNVRTNKWEDMPNGMLRGWNGPATSGDGDGDDVMYVVDEETGSISTYDGDDDRWDMVIKNSEYLKGADRISAFKGKLCVVSGDCRKIFVVDVSAKPKKVWVMDPPQGMEVVAAYVLPKMSLPESEMFFG